MTLRDDGDSAPRHAVLKRAALDGFLAGIPLGHGAPAPALGSDPLLIDNNMMALSRVAAGLLPLGVLTPAQRSAFGKRAGAPLHPYVRGTANGLRLCPTASPETAPEVVEALLAKNAAFEGFRLLGQRITNSGMDLRLLCGAFLWFLIDRVVGAIQGRLAAPGITAAARERLLDDFGPALLALDRVLTYPTERRVQLQSDRAQLQQEVADAQADAQVAETLLLLRQEMPIGREELLKAARRFMETRPPQAAEAPVGGSSGIIR